MRKTKTDKQLIAEFDGWRMIDLVQIGNESTFLFQRFDSNNVIIHNGTYKHSWDEFDYDKDWNLLMPLIGKLYNDINCLDEYLGQMCQDCRIDKVYEIALKEIKKDTIMDLKNTSPQYILNINLNGVDIGDSNDYIIKAMQEFANQEVTRVSEAKDKEIAELKKPGIALDSILELYLPDEYYEEMRDKLRPLLIRHINSLLEQAKKENQVIFQNDTGLDLNLEVIRGNEQKFIITLKEGLSVSTEKEEKGFDTWIVCKKNCGNTNPAYDNSICLNCGSSLIVKRIDKD